MTDKRYYMEECKPCDECGKFSTKKGYDPCVGYLENVKNACCGHGFENNAYVQFDHEFYKTNPNSFRLNGKDAIDYINDYKNG